MCSRHEGVQQTSTGQQHKSGPLPLLRQARPSSLQCVSARGGGGLLGAGRCSMYASLAFARRNLNSSCCQAPEEPSRTTGALTSAWRLFLIPLVPSHQHGACFLSHWCPHVSMEPVSYPTGALTSAWSLFLIPLVPSHQHGACFLSHWCPDLN